MAKEREVKGIAEWVHHEQINIDGHPDSISCVDAEAETPISIAVGVYNITIAASICSALYRGFQSSSTKLLHR